MTAARRFFIEGTREVGESITIAGSDAHKIANVLRLQAGDRIEVIDTGAATFSATIEELGRAIRVRLVEAISAPHPDGACLRIDVAQAVPKAQRMEFVVEKGTELGAGAFLPFYSERSIGREVGVEKLARWQRLAQTAAQQSGRREVPEILSPLQFDALLERFPEYDAVLFAWELAPQVPMRERVPAVLPSSGRVLLVVGPEGGFTHAEAESASRRGAELVWLGPRILRTDTAAMALLAVIGAFAS